MLFVVVKTIYLRRLCYFNAHSNVSLPVLTGIGCLGFVQSLFILAWTRQVPHYRRYFISSTASMDHLRGWVLWSTDNQILICTICHEWHFSILHFRTCFTLFLLGLCQWNTSMILLLLHWNILCKSKRLFQQAFHLWSLPYEELC